MASARSRFASISRPSSTASTWPARTRAPGSTSTLRTCPMMRLVSTATACARTVPPTSIGSGRSLISAAAVVTGTGVELLDDSVLGPPQAAAPVVRRRMIVSCFISASHHRVQGLLGNEDVDGCSSLLQFRVRERIGGAQQIGHACHAGFVTFADDSLRLAGLRNGRTAGLFPRAGRRKSGDGAAHLHPDRVLGALAPGACLRGARARGGESRVVCESVEEIPANLDAGRPPPLPAGPAPAIKLVACLETGTGEE